MADLTRRSLLTLGGAAGLLALAGPAEAATAASTVRRFAAPTATIGPRASFTPLLGRTILATGSHGSHRLTLVEIADVDHTGTGSATSFNLIFRPQRAGDFVEGIYRVSVSRAGSTPLLLTEVGPAGADRRIQALINRGH